MTAQGRYSRKHDPRPLPEDVAVVRIVGTPDVVRAIADRLAHVVEVARQSREIPRREEEGRVAIHLEVRATADLSVPAPHPSTPRRT